MAEAESEQDQAAPQPEPLTPVPSGDHDTVGLLARFCSRSGLFRRLDEYLIDLRWMVLGPGWRIGANGLRASYGSLEDKWRGSVLLVLFRKGFATGFSNRIRK